MDARAVADTTVARAPVSHSEREWARWFVQSSGRFERAAAGRRALRSRGAGQVGRLSFGRASTRGELAYAVSGHSAALDAGRSFALVAQVERKGGRDGTVTKDEVHAGDTALPSAGLARTAR